jgi:sugar transferase EpsL
MDSTKKTIYLAIKRLLDIILALGGLTVLFPVLFLVSILVWAFLGSPIIFAQIRPGKNGKPFKMVKFRSMTNEKDLNGNLLSNEKRLTKFGKFLRSTSLDELPELVNVLIGQMSVVGPRPLLMEYVELYDKVQARRMDMKPGITGWAQINGRNNISWERKLSLDVWYIKNANIVLDAKIILRTIMKVAQRDGIDYNDKLTNKFKGLKGDN